MVTKTKTKLPAVDKEALGRSIALARASDEPGRRRQINAMLHGDPERGSKPQPWAEVGQFCSYPCQMRSLCLRPWQFPPCWLGDKRPADDGDGRGLFDAWELRRRLIASGLSMLRARSTRRAGGDRRSARGDLPPAG